MRQLFILKLAIIFLRPLVVKMDYSFRLSEREVYPGRRWRIWKPQEEGNWSQYGAQRGAERPATANTFKDTGSFFLFRLITTLIRGTPFGIYIFVY